MSVEAKGLIEAAKAAMRHAHAPYSNFPVGAALLAEDGRVFTGANVENASFGLTMCAERIAFFKAASEGVRRIKAVAIVAEKLAPCPPCGACRQVLAEFGFEPTIVLEKDGEPLVLPLTELLPYGFSGAVLEGV